jgi:hypothetical protein
MNTINLDPQPSAFARQSEKESICQSCFRTVQGDRYLPLEVAEDIHADVCLVKPLSDRDSF